MGFKTIIVLWFVLMLLGSGNQLQSQTNSSFVPKLELGIETGYSFLSFNMANSLEVVNLSNTHDHLIVNRQIEQRNSDRNSAQGIIGIFGKYKFAKWFKAGIAVQYRQRIDYVESQAVQSDYELPNAGMEVSSDGRYEFSSELNLLSLLAQTTFLLHSFGNGSNEFSFFVDANAGISLISQTDAVTGAALNLEVVTQTSNGNFSLGPGSISPPRLRTTAFGWQLGAGMSFKSRFLPGIRIGARYADLGQVVFMLQDQKELFVLSAVNSGTPNQEISLNATQAKRRLSGIEVYLQLYGW